MVTEILNRNCIFDLEDLAYDLLDDNCPPVRHDALIWAGKPAFEFMDVGYLLEEAEAADDLKYLAKYRNLIPKWGCNTVNTYEWRQCR